MYFDRVKVQLVNGFIWQPSMLSYQNEWVLNDSLQGKYAYVFWHIITLSTVTANMQYLLVNMYYVMLLRTVMACYWASKIQFHFILLLPLI